jgi:hypothetical protein
MTDVATTMTATIAPSDQPIQRSPRTHVDSAPLPTDSMVTVPLSETETETDSRAPDDEQRACDSVEIREAFGRRQSHASVDATTTPTSPTISVRDTDAPVSPKMEARGRRTSNGSGKSEEVDWAELEKKEEQEPEGEEEVRPPRYVMPSSADSLL